MEQQPSRSSSVEQRSIDYVPAEERHGKPWHLFTLWFASNVQITGLVNGALAVTVGLDLPWAIFAILVGNLLGGVFMAYHSVQGPKLGIPQMIQSRAQFGFYGAVLPVAVVVAMYFGFALEGAVINGHAVASWLHIPYPAAVVLSNLVTLGIAAAGYNLIHAVSKYLSVVSGLVFVALFVKLGTHLPAHYHGTSVTAGTVLLAISIFASWQITWAPYVSDYSRYLPENTSPRRTFWWTYLGAAVGGSWVMVIGAFAAVIGADALGQDSIGFLAHQFPALSWLLVAALIVGGVPGSAQSPYGAFLAALSAVSPRGRTNAGPRARALFTIAFTAITTVLAILVGSNTMTLFENIILILLYLLIPWTAINLTDYYLVRHGDYDVKAFFLKDGPYGRCNRGAVVIFLLTVAVEFPFVNSSVYEGPLATSMGGADISWLVGLVFAALAYYLYTARVRRPAEGSGGSTDRAARLPEQERGQADHGEALTGQGKGSLRVPQRPVQVPEGAGLVEAGEVVHRRSDQGRGGGQPAQRVGDRFPQSDHE
ncbi:cytosine permease [Streptacidiphilus pinicola]|uniref:Cytosine permease n=1 Tax=Streptacidiphilus pinicola TaxID=2219663 RepID=A0A2X0II98_9ACTN|nr:cytosine permease [Streptacidiphilus pinicola]RAG83101.1 cytosine permease [Streptacidiphilus pinicola]